MANSRALQTEKLRGDIFKPTSDQLRAESNKRGVPMRYVVEAALLHFFDLSAKATVPVRPEMLCHMESTIRENSELLHRLAKF